MQLTDKVVIVTGASAGIGAATAVAFVREGAKVVLVGRNAQNLAATAEACRAARPDGDCLQLVADVTTDGKRIIDETIAKYGRLDVLVNNAGILAQGGLLEADVDQLDRILNTNVRSVFVLMQLAAPHLITTQGNVVNVSSVAGLRSFPGVISYGVSKAALDQMTRCAALDLAAHNVRVNAVNPGVIETDIFCRAGMTDDEFRQYLERCKETHALGRVGHVDEVAETILFLASSRASFITGACLPCDGGKQAMCPR